MLNRWAVNKLGLVNFWYYDEEEIQLSDGKLLLRGANGSGKSVTMQSFIPLLLDGNKRPERLDPFGTTARKIENYLLVNEGENERTAYLYMEFKKGQSDRYITIGMGLKAVKGRPVDSWYFIITDNRRIKIDLNLYMDKGIEKTPLTKRELENRIKSGGFFTDSQTKYKEKVNEYLFGYRDIESYDELINLLINIRTPKLSKDFKPTAMYEILENSLRQLTEDDLRPMSEAMENMDNIKLSIEQLENSLKSAKQIESYYNRYNTFILQEKASNYLKKYTAIKELQLKKDSLKQEIRELYEKVDKDQREKECFEGELQRAKTKLEQYKDSDILKTKEKLEKLKGEITNLLNDKDRKNKALDETKSKQRNIEIEVEGLLKEINNLDFEQEKLLVSLDDLAEEFDFKSHDIFKDDINFEFIKGSLTKHRLKISTAKEKLLKLDGLKQDHELKLQNRDKTKSTIDGIRSDLRESEEYMTTVKEEYIEKIVKWNRENYRLKLEEKDLQSINRSVMAVEKADEVFQHKSHITDRYNSINADYVSKIKVTEDKVDAKHLEISLKKERLKELEQVKEVEYPRSEEVKENRKRLQELGVPHIPLYKGVEFSKDLDEESKKAIESAIVDMGIIDALIVPQRYKDQILKNEALGSDKYLFSEPNIMIHNLTSFLQVDTSDMGEITFEDVDDVLNSIFLDSNWDNYLDQEGNFGLGLLKGKATKDYELKYIGATSRKEHRMRIIEGIKREITQMEAEADEQLNQLQQLVSEQQQLIKEYSLIPSTEDLRKILEIISGYLITLDIEEKQLTTIDEQLGVITDKIKSLKSELFQLIDGLEIEATYGAYQDAESAAAEYGELINDLKVLVGKIDNNKSMLFIRRQSKEELDLNIDQIMYDINGFNSSLRDKEAMKQAMEEILEKSDYALIKNEMDRCVEIANIYPQKISQLSTDIALGKDRIDRTISELKKEEESIVYNNQVLIQIKKIFNDEYKLGYVEEPREVTDFPKLCNEILKLYSLPHIKGREEYDSELNDVYQKHYGTLRDYQPKVVTIFSDPLESEGQEEFLELQKTKLRKDIHFRVNGKEVNFYKLMENLNQTIEDNKLLLSDKEREFFQDILLKTLSNKIKAKIYQSQKWVTDMNNLMQSMNTSSSFKLTLKWVPKKAEDEGQLDTNKLVEILQKDEGLVQQEDMKELSKHFSSKVKEIVRAYEDRKESRNYFTVIKEILDYRKWYEFKLYSQKEGEKPKELTNNAFFQLSGGEKAMGMYIPLFTAVYSRFDIADKKDCPRIVCLDEAFAGVDEGNIRDMFRILKEMNLDYILNSQVLWGDYDTVDSLAISEIIRPDNADFVTVINYQWNGREKVCLV